MSTHQLVVLNKDDDTISIIQPDTGETTTVIETAFNPHEVEVSPNGDRIFVTCSLGGKLQVFSTEDWELEATIEHEHFEFPHGLAIRESANELWLVATYSSMVFVIDLETLDFLEVFPTHQDKSHMVAIDAADRYAYIANIGSDSVTVIDCETRSVIADPPVGEGPEGIAVHPDAGILVANQEDGMLSVLDPDSRTEVNKALLGKIPIRTVIAPDGETVFVPNRESNDVSVIDPTFDRGGEIRPWEVARIPVGIWPGGTVFSPDGTRAFVANNKTNDVSVIDVEGRTEIDRFETGTHPDGIAYFER